MEMSNVLKKSLVALTVAGALVAGSSAIAHNHDAKGSKETTAKEPKAANDKNATKAEVEKTEEAKEDAEAPKSTESHN